MLPFNGQDPIAPLGVPSPEPELEPEPEPDSPAPNQEAKGSVAPRVIEKERPAELNQTKPTLPSGMRCEPNNEPKTVPRTGSELNWIQEVERIVRRPLYVEADRELKPEIKRELEPEIEPEPRPESKSEAKPTSKPDPTPEAKSDPKYESKSDPKPELKPELKLPFKLEPKPSEIPSLKPELQADQKPDFSPKPLAQLTPSAPPPPKQGAAQPPLPPVLDEFLRGGDLAKLIENFLPGLLKPQQLASLPSLNDPALQAFGPNPLIPAIASLPHETALPVLQLMMRMGCDPGARDAFGNTLLMYACRSGNQALCHYLLTACSGLNPQQLNQWGRNAAMVADDHGQAHLLPMLERAGVLQLPHNPALQWYFENRASYAGAGLKSDWSMFQHILGLDHFMNLRDSSGRTLLFHAVINADLNAVRFLCRTVDTPILSLLDENGASVFRHAAGIAEVEIGAAICQEMRSLRRTMPWLHKRRDDDFPYAGEALLRDPPTVYIPSHAAHLVGSAAAQENR